MMKKTIRFVCTELFQEDKRNNLLETMAKQGWSLLKTYGPLWVFQAQKKADVRYSSLWHYFKNGEEEKKKDMISFVEESGWQYVTSCGFLHIFKTEDDNAVPLETDALTTIMALYKTMIKTVVLPVLFVVVMCITFVLIQWHSLFTSPLFSFGGDGVNQGLFAMGGLILSAFAGIAFLGSYFNWYRKALHSAKKEGVVIAFTPLPHLIFTVCLLYLVVVILWIQRLIIAEDSAVYRILLIFMGSCTALLSIMQYRVMKQESGMKTMKRSICLVLLGVVCCGIALFVPAEKKDSTLPIEQAPLVKDDFGDASHLEYISSYKQNFLFDRLDVSQYEEGKKQEHFGYTYINCHVVWLEEALFNDLLRWMESSHRGTFYAGNPDEYDVDDLYIYDDEEHPAYLFHKGKDMACITFGWQPADHEVLYAIETLIDWP